MLIHLYSTNLKSSDKSVTHVNGNTASRGNGSIRIPSNDDRQAHDAQEFELEGLMSDEDEADAKAMKHTNGRAA